MRMWHSLQRVFGTLIHDFYMMWNLNLLIPNTSVPWQGRGDIFTAFQSKTDFPFVRFLLTPYMKLCPSWDPRTKLNCLQTVIASAKTTERIRNALEDYASDPPLSVQKYVLDECRKWNLVWVGRNKFAPLEPDEMEMLLGFPRNHTWGGGISITERYRSLGNSFQVDTVAYHLSVLKDLFPGVINLLSLFSGIGGTEVALHCLGIPLKNVVSVEISEVNRGIMRSWWEQTNQRGNLIDIADVQHLNADR